MATFISNDEAAARVSDPNNLLNRLAPEGKIEHKPMHNGGRTEGVTNIPMEVRAMVGVAAQLDTAKNVGDAFGVSPQQVHNIKHGRTTYLDGQNPELLTLLRKNKYNVASKALDKLLESVGMIDLTQLKDPVKMAEIASRLAGVVDKMGGSAKEEAPTTSKIQIVVYSPDQKPLEKMGEVIDVTVVEQN